MNAKSGMLHDTVATEELCGTRNQKYSILLHFMISVSINKCQLPDMAVADILDEKARIFTCKQSAFPNTCGGSLTLEVRKSRSKRSPTRTKRDLLRQSVGCILAR